MNDNNNDLEKLDENKIIIENNNNNIDYINQLESKIKYLEDELNNLKKKELDNNLRYKAEIENINRRTNIEIEKAYKFSLENFMSELILVIDNLEMSINININKIDLNIKEGLELTLKSFIKIVNKFGLFSIEDINVPFNPLIHQAVIISSSKNNKSNYVIEIMQKGYLLNGRLIRPAMVQVSSDLENEKNISFDNL